MTAPTTLREAPQPPPGPGEPYPVPDPGEPYPAPDPRRKARLRRALLPDFYPGLIRRPADDSTPLDAA